MGMTGTFVALSDKDFEKHKKEGINIYELTDEIGDNNENLYVDVDKSWDSLAFTFNKFKDKNAKFVVPLTGEDDEELMEAFESEYGVFFVNSKQVKLTQKFLEKITSNDLKEKFDLNEMLKNNIYPIVAGEDADDFFEYMENNLEPLQDLFKTAVDLDYGVLLAIL